jgi:hypothetical protein
MLLSGAALTLGAQTARGAGLDLMLGAQRSTGGLLQERRGLFVDATAAMAMRTAQAMPLVFAAGTSGVVANTDDSCLVLPSGGCAPSGNVALVHVNLDAARRIGTATVRGLVGPARVVGGGNGSTGLHIRVDGCQSAAGHFGLGAMMRVVHAPAHGAYSHTMWPSASEPGSADCSQGRQLVHRRRCLRDGGDRGPCPQSALLLDR